MEMELLTLYPLCLVIDGEDVIIKNYEEHLRYVFCHDVPWGCYDDFIENNIVMKSWKENNKAINPDSAIFQHKNAPGNCDSSRITLELDQEFENINTTLPVGQRLFRDTKIEDIPAAYSTRYMPASPIPNVYSNYEYNTTLVLTIKSPGIKCHYYGSNDDTSNGYQHEDDYDNSICEWEILLQRGLIFKEIKRYSIPDVVRCGNSIIRSDTRTIIEFEVTAPF